MFMREATQIITLTITNVHINSTTIRISLIHIGKQCLSNSYNGSNIGNRNGSNQKARTSSGFVGSFFVSSFLHFVNGVFFYWKQQLKAT